MAKNTVKKALPVQDRALKKRLELIQSAISLFEKVGYEGTTAKLIAEQAGVATGTFYQNFHSKNDVLLVIAQERADHVQRQIGFFERSLFKQFLNVINENDASMDMATFRSALLTKSFERSLNFVYRFHMKSPFLHQVLEQRKMVDAELAAVMKCGDDVVRQTLFQFVRGLGLSDHNQEEMKIVAENLFSMGEGIVHRAVFDNDHCSKKKVLESGAKMLAAYFYLFMDAKSNK